MKRSMIKEGTWLYGNSVLSKIVLEARDTVYRSGDCEDSSEVREDKIGKFSFCFITRRQRKIVFFRKLVHSIQCQRQNLIVLSPHMEQ